MAEMNIHELWNKACFHLQALLHPDVYARWIAVIEPDTLQDHTLQLRVDNNFYQSWLEDNYLDLIRQAIASACGIEVKIQFVVSPRAPADKTEAAVSAAKSAPRRNKPPAPVKEPAGRSGSFETPLNPKFTFDEFIVGPSNHFAHAAAMAVSQAPGRAYNPLFIYGGTGLGKTHLMQAIGHSVMRLSHAKVAYLSCEAFLNEYIFALQNHSLPAFRKKYRQGDVLLIDDIHFLAGKDGIQEEFFHTFNALHDARKQIVINSDRPAAEIKGLEQRLVSRFEWGLVTELQPPELETRIAILRNIKDQGHLMVSNDAISFIADAVRSNIRRLEGALIRVASYASLKGRELTVAEIEGLLRDTLEQEKQETLSFDMIMRTVAEHYDIRLADMTSKRRPQAIAMPRQIAMYLCRTMTSSSLPEIAVAFGKTHATILHAFRSIEKRISQSAELQQAVAQLTHHLEHRRH